MPTTNDIALKQPGPEVPGPLTRFCTVFVVWPCKLAATLAPELGRIMAKRFFDIVLAAIGLVFLSPIFLIVAIASRLSLGSPVLFRQVRPGFQGRPFTLFKFRTMNDARDQHGDLLPDSARLTPYGRFLRRFSLDELPQLWNVLRGDMSLVGPRPLLMEYLDRYTPAQSRRHNVRPGITGWAQVSGRNNLVFSRRLELDVWYVDHQSFLLDLKILALTFWYAIRSSGVRLQQELSEVDDIGLNPDTAKQRESASRTAGTS